MSAPVTASHLDAIPLEIVVEIVKHCGPYYLLGYFIGAHQKIDDSIDIIFRSKVNQLQSDEAKDLYKEWSLDIADNWLSKLCVDQDINSAIMPILAQRISKLFIDGCKYRRLKKTISCLIDDISSNSDDDTIDDVEMVDILFRITNLEKQIFERCQIINDLSLLRTDFFSLFYDTIDYQIRSYFKLLLSPIGKI
jgi:hypothetical protein